MLVAGLWSGTIFADDGGTTGGTTTTEWEEKHFKIGEISDGGSKKIKAILGLNEEGKKFLEKNKNLIIPAINGVTAIGIKAFEGLDFKSVDMEKSKIEKIKMGAFFSCREIEEVKFPKELMFLESYAFNSNSSLTSIDLSKTNILKIEHDTFYGCGLTSLKSEQLPPSLGEISKEAFRGNFNLTEVDLYETNVFRIQEKAFAYCGIVSVTTARLPKIFDKKVTSINVKGISGPIDSSRAYLGKGVFWGNFKLTEIDLKGSRIKKLDENLFYSSAIKTLSEENLPKEDNIEIKERAFAQSINLETVDLKNINIKKIDEKTFAESKKLVSVDLRNDQIIEIGKRSFDTTGIRSMEIPATLKTIGEDSFLKEDDSLEGWTDGTKKAALYRRNLEGGEYKGYVTDNSVADGETFVINPVLVEIKAVDASGNPLPDTATVKAKLTRTRSQGLTAGEVTNAEFASDNPDIENVKLGDAISVEIDPLSGYDFKSVSYAKDGGSSEKLTTAKVEGIQLNDAETVHYGDNHLTGYKRVSLVATFAKQESSGSSSSSSSSEKDKDKDKDKDKEKDKEQEQGKDQDQGKDQGEDQDQGKETDEEKLPDPVPNPVPNNPRPAYPRNNVPDPNDPASPDEITLIGENGVPLGNYVKKTNPDGTMQYVLVDEEVPLAGKALPKTGGYGVYVIALVGLAAVVTGLALRRKED